MIYRIIIMKMKSRFLCDHTKVKPTTMMEKQNLAFFVFFSVSGIYVNSNEVNLMGSFSTQGL